jgi:hypothetical protein
MTPSWGVTAVLGASRKPGAAFLLQVRFYFLAREENPFIRCVFTLGEDESLLSVLSGQDLITIQCAAQMVTESLGPP